MDSGERWTILNHIHSGCCGRLLERIAPDGTAIARCSDCGKEIAGSHEAICWCGVPAVAGRTRFKCALNPNRTPQSPSEFVAIEVTT